MVERMLCKRYKKNKEQMIDIKKASFELLMPEESVRKLLKSGALRSLKIKHIAKFIERIDNESQTA